MRDYITQASLSPERRRLLEWCQQISYGRIRELVIVDGEPILDPLPDFECDVKFGGENGPRPELTNPDCALKRQVVELLHYFDELGSGTIKLLELKAGLPFLMRVGALLDR